MKFSNGIVANVSEEALWLAWSDVPSWPRWDTELIEAALEGPFAAGTAGKMRSKKGGVWSAFRIVEVRRDKGYSCIVPMPGGELRFDRTFERIGPGMLRITHDLIFGGALGWLYAWLVGRPTNRIYPELLRLFVEVVREKEQELRTD
ncbi:hypothetical protein [Cohnella zeiphila]|uniref:Polyketide cyclase n=1 Tax=Cohnella zeiphila TaxID=2761120 RepID=A0A7X0SX84_9BACL|nr:hypothetical protein [Cohnella zeiphila]MBB6735588.1 hypothetical protein [Cohnella zeiphila]